MEQAAFMPRANHRAVSGGILILICVTVFALYHYISDPIFAPVLALSLLALPAILRNKAFLIGLVFLVFFFTQTSVTSVYNAGEMLRWVLLGLCLALISIEYLGSWKKHTNRGKTKIWMWIFLALAAFSFGFSVNPSMTLQYVVALTALFGVILFLIRPYAFRHGIEKVLDIILYAAFPIYFLSFFLIGDHSAYYSSATANSFESLQRSNVSAKAFGTSGVVNFPRFHGLFENPNTIGVVTGLLFPLILHKLLQPGKRKFYLGFAGIMLTLLFLSGSREGMLAAFSGSLYIIFRRFNIKNIARKITFWLVILFPIWLAVLWAGLHSGALAGYFRVKKFDLMSGRLEAWIAAVQLLSHRPWLGYGFGTEGTLFQQAGYVFMFHEGSMVHNAFLGMALQLGIVGLLIFFVPLFSLFFKELFTKNLSPTRIALQAVLLSGLLLCFFESWIYSPGNSQVLPFWTAVVLLEYLRDTKPSSVQQEQAS